MEDTFVGGETSNAIYLWFAIGLLNNLNHIYSLFSKKLKSQKTLLNGLTYFWIFKYN